MVVRAWLSAGLVLACAASVASAQDAAESEMLARINAMRAEAGLSPLERHPGLDAAARRHSEDMAEHGELGHVSERTGDPASRVRDAGVELEAIAENVTRNADADAAHAAIASSEAHRAQLLNAEMTHVGIGFVRSDDGQLYVTQLFGRIEAPAAAVEALPPPDVSRPAQRVGDVQQHALPPTPTPPAAPVERPQAQPQARPPVPSQPPVAPGQPLAVQGPGGRTRGYWVFGSGRWWYYPVPPGARPGQRLQPAAGVYGPPPGYGPDGQPLGSSRHAAVRVSPPSSGRVQLYGPYGHPTTQPYGPTPAQPYGPTPAQPYGPSGWSSPPPPPPGTTYYYQYGY